jgi:hypothetical protein
LICCSLALITITLGIYPDLDFYKESRRKRFARYSK